MSKQPMSKKAKQAREKQIIEDNTFGLKNKNKSKKVQQFVSRVEKAAKQSTGSYDKERQREAKKEAKLAKQEEEYQLKLLLGESLRSERNVNFINLPPEKETIFSKLPQEVIDYLEGLSSEEESENEELLLEELANEEEESEDENEAVGYEVFREKTIEDIIEEQRAKLAAEGKKGTPVTEETFAIWKKEKQRRKQEELEARVKAEQAKKKGGKGLSVLSGKELFSFNSSLFIDDDSAIDTSNNDSLIEELKAAQEKEEQLQKEETEKAQAEQNRLAEIQKVEYAARELKFNELKELALQKNNIIEFNGVKVNKDIFSFDDEEDLELFYDEKFLPSNADEICALVQRMELTGDGGLYLPEDDESDEEEGGEDREEQESQEVQE